MNKTTVFFSELYSGAFYPTAVFSGSLEPIYENESMTGMIRRYRLSGAADLLSFGVRTEAERCLSVLRGGSAVLQLEEESVLFFLLPYPHGGENYIVLQAVEPPASQQDREWRLALRNAQGKLSAYLNEIYAVAEEMREEYPRCSVICRNVRRMMRMANHLYQCGEDENRYEYRVPLGIGDFLTGYRRTVGELETGIRLTVDDASGNAAIRFDPDALELILSTLISNAYRFGGNPINVRAGKREGEITLSVIDRGPGFENPLRAFEFGYRTPDRNGALGLGFSLAMARKIAEKNGADLEYKRVFNETHLILRMPEELLPESQLGEWQFEPKENSLSQIRVELSDAIKEEFE